MSKLYRIYNSDGDTSVEEITEKEVLQDIADEESDGSEYLSELPNKIDTNYWPEDSILLIRGEIVRPKPKKTVTVQSWEIKP